MSQKISCHHQGPLEEVENILLCEDIQLQDLVAAVIVLIKHTKELEHQLDMEG